MPSVPVLSRMSARDPEEADRASTPLELFFDLTFVVAVAQASSTLHHQLIDGHARDGLLAYPLVFFAIWWAWMNFTWFASAYDPDDAVYRVMVLIQMAGVLIFAAGVPRFLEDFDLSIVVLGYVVMRIALVPQWLRAAAQHPEGKATAYRYAIGITACQIGWVLLLFAPDGWWIAGFVVLGVAELALPTWAERVDRTAWNPRHIGERYGLFTIIVLGESVLAATVALQVAVDAGSAVSELVTTAVGGFLIVSSMWWAYFDQPVEEVLARAREAFTNHTGYASFIWGYGHYFVFASAAAVGVGLAVAVDQAIGHTALSDTGAALVLTVPVAVFLLSVWMLHRAHKDPGPLRTWAAPVTAALILATSWTREPALWTGLITAGLIAITVIAHSRRAARDTEHASLPRP